MTNESSKKYSAVYIVLLCVAFFSMALVFNFFPRSKVSELEKRELAVFPKYTEDALLSGEFTKKVSSWYSDSEPYRDVLMQLSMTIKDMIGIAPTENNVRFHAAKTTAPADDEYDDASDRNVGAYKNEITADDNAKIANAGIIVVGKGDKVRALMAFGGSSKGGGQYSEAANKYKEVFGDKVHVYCMVIPTAAEFYCPDNALSCTRPQRPTINHIYSQLSPKVKAVDIYTPLGRHAKEDIYLRTDHHWAPLGAYYAAQKFAQVAGVPFKPLSSYERKVVHGYVGSMYGYSNDISVKNAPEDFVYYVPKNVKYTTTYIDYTVDKNYHVTSVSKPYKSIFFYHYKDGSGGAYCTFMGSDMRITQVRTAIKNHRRLMILKDSFGNAIPGYLFYSFEEIHVVDYRYFGRNMKKYVEENKITDILFANNIFNAYSPKIYKRYLNFLTQGDNVLAAPATKSKAVVNAKEETTGSAAHDKTPNEKQHKETVPASEGEPKVETKPSHQSTPNEKGDKE